MFEGSLVESGGRVASKEQRWSAAGSLIFQCAGAALLIAVPMLRPATMPVKIAAPQITVPNLKRVEIVHAVAEAAVSSATAMALSETRVPVEQTRGFMFSTREPVGENDPAPLGPGPVTMGSASGTLASVMAIGGAANATAIVGRRATTPMRISQGVSNGMLLTPIIPAYPMIAQVARVQGTVVIEAVISKGGRIESLNVESGPEMLRAAALEAVARARYAPYKLNGEPVEVQTMIRVEFRLN